MIKGLNKNIQISCEEQLNERLASELEERTEFACWNNQCGGNICETNG